MNCHPKRLICTQVFTVLLAGFVLLNSPGCTPSPPIYRCDNGNLDYYLEQATEIESPDTQTVPLDEVMQQRAPITVTDADFDSFWDLCLEDCVSIALQNSKVIRGFGTPGLSGGRVAPGVDGVIAGGSGVGTLYNVAIRESEPGIIGIPGQISSPSAILTNGALEANQGVEAALADFDAQFTSSLTYAQTDSPSNVNPINNPLQPQIFQQDQVQFNAEIAKKSANGTQFFFRNVSSYTDNNIPSNVQPLRFIYQTAFEAEIRQPLLRGRGAFINRMPVMISRIQTDQEIANLEATIQNMVTNVEIRYWDLQCAYRNLETAKTGRDAALDTWRMLNENFKSGKIALQEEAEAREQYFFFRAQVETAWAALLDAESDLRWLMGIASTDGRLCRPIDEPIKAWVNFDWCDALDEALSYRPELRQERWEIRKRELQLAYSKNSLLPTLNATGLYRWLGVGEKLANYDSPPIPGFPANDSGAFNELYDGNYQEANLGLEFGLPLGFRRELANVRNAQLKLAEQIAILEDMELDAARELSQAMRALDLQYELIQSNFNRWVAATSELDARLERYEAGTDPISFVLDSQRRRSQGEQAFYQALCEYNKMIALIHRRKGTILAYCNVCMGEGPWADKAYHDASENARRRGASRYVDYGWSRPEVISLGAMQPTTHDSCPDGGCLDGRYPTYDNQHLDSYPNQPETIQEVLPSTPSPGPSTELLPEPAPTPDQTPNVSPGDSDGDPRETRSNQQVPPIISGSIYRRTDRVPPAPNMGQFSRPLRESKSRAVIRRN